MAHSTRLSPKDQTSESNEYAPPLILSGDMYVTVPTQLLHLVTLLASCPLTPKSESLASPARFTNTLLGLTSLCTTLASSWRYRSASSICAANPASWRSGIRPSARVTSDSEPPSMCSSTMEMEPSPKYAPWYRTTRSHRMA